MSNKITANYQKIKLFEATTLVVLWFIKIQFKKAFVFGLYRDWDSHPHRLVKTLGNRIIATADLPRNWKDINGDGRNWTVYSVTNENGFLFPKFYVVLKDTIKGETFSLKL